MYFKIVLIKGIKKEGYKRIFINPTRSRETKNYIKKKWSLYAPAFI